MITDLLTLIAVCQTEKPNDVFEIRPMNREHRPAEWIRCARHLKEGDLIHYLPEGVTVRVALPEKAGGKFYHPSCPYCVST